MHRAERNSCSRYRAHNRYGCRVPRATQLTVTVRDPRRSMLTLERTGTESSSRDQPRPANSGPPASTTSWHVTSE
jgi:hypothetical protein